MAVRVYLLYRTLKRKRFEAGVSKRNKYRVSHSHSEMRKKESQRNGTKKMKEKERKTKEKRRSSDGAVFTCERNTATIQI